MSKLCVCVTCCLFAGNLYQAKAQTAPPTVGTFTIMVPYVSGTSTAASIGYGNVQNASTYTLTLTAPASGYTIASGGSGSVVAAGGDISFTLATTGGEALPVGDYTVKLAMFGSTDIDGGDGTTYCTSEQSFVVSVKPVPTFASTTSPTVFCSGSLDLSGGISVTNTYLSYKGYSYTVTAGSLTGAGIANAGKTQADTLNLSSLEVVNSAKAQATITYSVKPFAVYKLTNSDGVVDTLLVEGSASDVVLTVNPALDIDATAPDSPFCSAVGDANNVEIALASSLTGGTNTYKWKLYDIAAGDVDVNEDSEFQTGAALNGTDFVTKVVNEGADRASLVYVFEQTYVNTATCTKTDTVIVGVYPVPQITLSANDTVCSGLETPYTFVVTNSTSEQTTLAYSIVKGANITNANGTLTGGTLDASGTLTVSGLTDDSKGFINTAGSIQTVTYTVTPTINASCTGTVQNHVVSVSPAANITLSDPVLAICNNTTGGVTLASTASGSQFVIKGTGITDSLIVSSIGAWATPAALTNEGDSLLKVEYKIYNVVGGICKSAVETYSVDVVPKLEFELNPDEVLACSEDPAGAIDVSSTLKTAIKSKMSFNWQIPYDIAEVSVVAPTEGVTNTVNGTESILSGTGTVPALTLKNETSGVQTLDVFANATYTDGGLTCYSASNAADFDAGTGEVVATASFSLNPKPSFTLRRATGN
ncbi:MAG: hypothetical protein LBM07_03255 [Culturomica sp.]|nr:hypothetical protein [Culturomica sp.]